MIFIVIDFVNCDIWEKLLDFDDVYENNNKSYILRKI